jgi:Ser/Thr protein kinase RdoA (MazF antagonist)
VTRDAPDIEVIAGRFQVDGPVSATRPLPGGGGHINDTYRVETSRARYLLQRLNPHVFPRPDLVMENVALVSRLLARRNASYPGLIPARDGRDWVTDPAGATWRMFSLVLGVTTRERVRSPEDARGAGQAFGEFLHLLADRALPLHETLPGFHDTRARFARLEMVVHDDRCGRASGAGAEIDAVLAGRDLADVMPPLIASGAVPLRPVHNDAKIANVLFDERTGAPRCVIDLDTVMTGSALHDFGDLVRSSVSPTAEDEADLSRVGARLDLFEALVRGYLEGSGETLTKDEHRLLEFAGRLITLEQALRFLTDHLDGDRYYKIARPDHNLVRCRSQLALLRSLTEQRAALERIVAAA